MPDLLCERQQTRTCRVYIYIYIYIIKTCIDKIMKKRRRRSNNKNTNINIYFIYIYIYTHTYVYTFWHSFGFRFCFFVYKFALIWRASSTSGLPREGSKQQVARKRVTPGNNQANGSQTGPRNRNVGFFSMIYSNICPTFLLVWFCTCFLSDLWIDFCINCMLNSPVFRYVFEISWFG